MENRFDFDKYLLFILPVFWILFLLILKEEAWFFVNSLFFVVILYEVLIFKNRYLYGFSGIRVLSMPSIILLSYTVLIALPSVYVVLSNENPVRYPYFIAITSFYFFYPIGLVTANRFFPIKELKYNFLFNKSFQKDKIDEFMYEMLLTLLSLSILIFVVYLYRTPTIPLLEMLTNPRAYMVLWIMREESMKLLEVSFIEKYMFAWLRDLFLPLGLLGSLFLFDLYKKRQYIFLFLGFLLLGIVNNSLTIAKAPTAALFLSIAAFYFMKHQQLNLRFILIFIVLIFSFPYMVYHFVSQPEFRSPENLLNSIFNRVFVVPAQVLFEYFKIFPIKHEFLFGRSSNLLSWIHSDGIFNLANYVAKIWWHMPNTTGNANAIYIGYFWADFGWIGIILSSYLIGITLHLFYRKLLLVSNFNKNSVYVIITSGSVMTFSFTFVSTNITSLLLTRGLLLILLILFIIEWVNKNKKYKRIRENVI